MSNINGDLLDDGLQAVMGKERCKDVTEQMKQNPNPIQGTSVSEGAPPVAGEATEGSAAVDKIKDKRKPADFIGSPQTGKEKHDPMAARWEYAEENWLDRLRTMFLRIITPGLLCWFFFWCQQTERMDNDTAVCAMFVCVGVVFFRIGRGAK